jgi:hypothetical protein
MTHYEYTTPEKKEVRIPLEKAREMVLQDAAQGKTFYPAKPTMPKPEAPPEAPPEVKGDSKEAAKEVAKK